MRIRNVQRHADEQVDLQMTPMIDMVFLLLVFFLLTFKIASPEGDFNIKMPLAAPSEGLPDDSQLPPIKIRLRADSNGNLAGIQLGQRGLGRRFDLLRENILKIVGQDTGPGSVAESTEVELDCDYNLKFESVIDAITAVSGYIEGGEIVKLIEKIKFSPPRPE
jgi:biopolymer transport protein ExbD